ncbi:MAG: rhamnulokinase family protein [Candidatus Electryonea clarkiae]|nr:rhamnulokinase family protein [Candidatus Electryonea clarkiae]MDP8286598.1 rhamnulokinase family protein [Candidatus Electryonea clarkiae]
MNHQGNIFLVVDLGAESGRIIACSFDGERFTQKETLRFPNNPVRSSEELQWDVDVLWGHIKNGLTRAAFDYGDSIVSIGVDTWGVDFGLFSNDMLLDNPFNYRDSRTDNVMESVFEVIPRSEIFKITGVQFLQFNTLYQLYSMVKAGDFVLDQAKHLLTIPDIFNFLLTGKKVTEFSNATTTQCYNPFEGKWAYPLLEKLGIPVDIFGAIVQPGTIIDSIKQDVTEETGIGLIPVIAPASHDTGSAVAAIPMTDRNAAYISSGTWSLMGVEVDEPNISDDAQKFNFTNEGGVDGTFRLLKNISGLWLIQECRRAWEKEGNPYTYRELTEMAEQSQDSGALIDPADGCFLSPENMPEAISQFCRDTEQAIPQSKGDIIHCVLRSLALEYRYVLNQLETLTGRELKTIHIVGGGSQNRLLNRFAADATGCLVLAGPMEATSLGNAMIQAVSMGLISSVMEGRSIINLSFPCERFEPQQNVEWEEMYESFLKLKQGN